MTWAMILGTRPEIIKFSPLIEECIQRKKQFVLVHTGQHYQWDMDKIFFEELKLPNPEYMLNVGSHAPGKQTAAIIEGVEKVLETEKPDITLVLGDTNTTLGGAIAACKFPTQLAHIESGCRSYNQNMPEEKNRIVADHLADILLAPSQNEVENLKKEGLTRGVNVVGSTQVDACLRNAPLSESKKNVLKERNLTAGAYCVVTVHRAENTDNKKTLQEIVYALHDIGEWITPLFVLHPRTRKRLDEFGIRVSEKVNLTEPVGYLEMLYLIQHARMVLTDSGGLQEDCAVLKTPCFTLRNETEWVQTVQQGLNVVAGNTRTTIVSKVESFLKRPVSKGKNKSEYGKASASARILESLLDASHSQR